MHPARRLWSIAEPIHAVVYFADEVRGAFERRGLRGFWRSYFAARAAPMGAVGAGVVAATFYGFHPAFVKRAVPDVWATVPPDDALHARLEGVAAVLRRVGVAADADACAAAASLMRDALAECSVAGRPLFGANAELDTPDAPHLALWHAATLLREHRGDGHVAALTAADLTAAEAHVSRLASDGAPAASIQPHRGFSDDDWGAATASLRRRGWIDRDGRLTDAGRRGRERVEARTDELAARPIDRLGGRVADLEALLAPLAQRVLDAGLIPYPNAMGVPRPPQSGSASGR